MAFKIKDGIRIGTVDVFNNAGQLLVNAPTATSSGGTVGALNFSNAGDGAGAGFFFNGSLARTISYNSVGAAAAGQTMYIGTTAVTINRASGALALTGITSIDGNSATVTNGVYTTSSYADPAWITSLAKSKVGLGSVENTALSTWAGSTNITTIGAATATSLTVSGNLVVNGTTTTINSTTVTLDDPIITLGGDTAPGSDDAKDRGVEFRWHNGSVAKVGFFGYDRSTGKFTFIPDATNSSEAFSGTKGTLDANIEWADILNKPSVGTGSVTSVGLSVPTGLTVSGSPITSSGTLAVTFTAGYSIPTTTSQTNWDTAYTDRNKWDGGATGLVASTGRTSLGATTIGGNLFTLANPSAVTFLRLNADNTVSTLDAATFRSAIGAQTSGSYLTSYTETDTLASVTGRGASTATAISLTNTTDSTSTSTGALIVSGGVAVAKNLLVAGELIETTTGGTKIAHADVIQTTVATTASTAVDSWAVASFRAVKYLVQITQGTNSQISEVMVIHNGTTTTMTEFAVLETNGALGIITSDISAGNARLLVIMGSATSATVNIQRTLMVL
jgi:hypothetical protein